MSVQLTCCECRSGIECFDCPGHDPTQGPYWKMNHPVTGQVVPCLADKATNTMRPAVKVGDKWVIEGME